MMPEKWFVFIAKKVANGYLDKYAKINVEGFENAERANGPKIFICNHLSNSDGLILDRILKEKYDPFFIAGVKLSDDPVTSLGAKLVKSINIKPNSADKDAMLLPIATGISVLFSSLNAFIIASPQVYPCLWYSDAFIIFLSSIYYVFIIFLISIRLSCIFVLYYRYPLSHCPHRTYHAP